VDRRSADERCTRTRPDGTPLELGPLRADERAELFAVFAVTVATRAGYPHAPPLTDDDFRATWTGPVTTVFAARDEGGLLGAYYLKPNFVGRAAHVANAGYLVHPDRRGRGIGRLLVEDSIWRAPRVGFDAIQFNLVFASNPARRLYEELGWRQTGIVPDAVEGEDAVVYWRRVP
jgi:GNAT superfamily N-acetyltransferase